MVGMDVVSRSPILKGILQGEAEAKPRPDSPVRFGRVPKREKAKLLAAMQSVSRQQQQQHQTALAEAEEGPALAEAVIQAHLQTCQFTGGRVRELLERARRSEGGEAAANACPLIPEPSLGADLGESQLFGPHIKAVVEFAKRLPGFLRLPEEDRVALLKTSVFEVLLVWLAATFDAETRTVACLNGQLVRRDAYAVGSQPRFLLDSMFEFAAQLNSLRLSDAELGLFCACVVLTPERPGLRSAALVRRLRDRLDAALRERLVRHAQPDAHAQLLRKTDDLKTLNSLHADLVRSLRGEESPATASPAWSAATPRSAARSPCSASSGYVGSEEEGRGRSPTPPSRELPRLAAALLSQKRRAEDDGRLAASSPPASPPTLLEGGGGSEEYMPLLKQALAAPGVGSAEHPLPHKKFRWLRRESGVEGEAEPDEGVGSSTPTLRRILGAPPQRPWSSEQIRQREVVARLLGMSAAGGVSVPAAPAPAPAPAREAAEQPLNLTKGVRRSSVEAVQ